MRLRGALALLFVAACAGTACSSGGSDSGPNTAAYLTIVHSPTIGNLARASDASLLADGNRACADMNRGMASDAVVSDLSADALPGSADFNAYSMITAAAGKELCPQHAADFGVDPSALP